MKFTIEEHPDRIARYSHIKAASRWGSVRCGALCGGTSRTCTLEGSHRGPHVAHGRFGKVVAVWDSGVSAQPSAMPVPRPKTPVSRGSSRDEGLVSPFENIFSAIARAAPTLEAGAFIVLFLGMLMFVIDWALRIAGIK